MNTIQRLTGFISMIAIAVMAVSCGGETLPKPEAYLRLDYPMGKYVALDQPCPYTFGYNSMAQLKPGKDCSSLEIHYPKMKATIYLNYKPINGNLEELLRDAQTLTYKQVVKADDIREQPYINPEKKSYGMFYEVGGNAATNAQFYVTDSLNHFLAGSVYFYAKPNFDSIMPAASYLRDDMRNIMETVKWK
ncbi:gliding motility lipoprotein GldD [Flavobacterium sp. AG291]|uniref:gliding motility lipoprotein GldD n=1 Tax=Flavobacterium sp. AG291 TaxID=2184000 RepID=UPI000E0BF78B|nr:gliding motility lipoprotein GldD [Flavobacterium sp. AG291]RDI11887.1 protein involved in gliding motility GldD [Flavobacterium sp. AG291]